GQQKQSTSCFSDAGTNTGKPSLLPTPTAITNTSAKPLAIKWKSLAE
nr:hypothetical protein [Tanacetum cinerariifolium]